MLARLVTCAVPRCSAREFLVCMVLREFQGSTSATVCVRAPQTTQLLHCFTATPVAYCGFLLTSPACMCTREITWTGLPASWELAMASTAASHWRHRTMLTPSITSVTALTYFTSHRRGRMYHAETLYKTDRQGRGYRGLSPQISNCPPPKKKVSTAKPLELLVFKLF